MYIAWSLRIMTMVVPALPSAGGGISSMSLLLLISGPLGSMAPSLWNEPGGIPIVTEKRWVGLSAAFWDEASPSWRGVGGGVVGVVAWAAGAADFVAAPPQAARGVRARAAMAAARWNLGTG